MRHLNIQDIMTKRKNTKIKQQIHLQNQSSSKTQKPTFRQINDVTIDTLIQKQINKKLAMTTENKLDILQIISQKIGVNLNKSIVLEKMGSLYCQGVKEVNNSYQRNQKSYFILRGQVRIYQEKEKDKGAAKFNTQPLKSYNNLQDQEEQSYIKIQDFIKYNPDFIIIQEYKDFRGFGPLFQSKYNHNINEKRKKLVAIDAVLISFQEVNLQFQSLFNDGIANQQKLQILNQFPILKLMGKKLHSFLNSFKVKRFTLKDFIYKQGQKPKAVYFIIKGEVGFQLILEEETGKSNKNVIHTDVLSDCNYFGEEEIILTNTRVQAAKVISSKCMILQIQRQKFEKCMENPQFSEMINKTLKERMLKREQKLTKIRNIMQIEAEKTENKISQRLTEDQVKRLIINDKHESKRKFSTRRKSHATTRVMHGNLIRQYQGDNEVINFSMLKVNPDMYDAVKKNYRIYDVKPLEYDKPSVKDFKKIWNILKLEDVLRQEEINISGPEGRKYYDSHLRLKAHVNQSKSIRPKTSSSNYKTKLQYIAYLQQFNN